MTMPFPIFDTFENLVNVHWKGSGDICVLSLRFTRVGDSLHGPPGELGPVTISDFDPHFSDLFFPEGVTSFNLTPRVPVGFVPGLIQAGVLPPSPAGDELPFDDILVEDKFPSPLPSPPLHGVHINPISSEMFSRLLMWTPVRPIISGTVHTVGTPVWNPGHWCYDIVIDGTWDVVPDPTGDMFDYFTIDDFGIATPTGVQKRYEEYSKVNDTGTTTVTVFNAGSAGVWLLVAGGGVATVTKFTSTSFLFINLTKARTALSGLGSLDFTLTFPTWDTGATAGLSTAPRGVEWHIGCFRKLNDFPFYARDLLSGAEIFDGWISFHDLGWDQSKQASWDFNGGGSDTVIGTDGVNSFRISIKFTSPDEYDTWDTPTPDPYGTGTSDGGFGAG